MSGWIKMHRSILEWEWYTDTNTKSLFLHLLLKANHKPKSWQGTAVKRGQIMTGRKILSVETGLSEQQIRTSLNRLSSTNEITIDTTNKNSIITIVNYDLYQFTEDVAEVTNQQSTSVVTSNQPAINQQSTSGATTTKEDKNVKNEEECKEIEESIAAGAEKKSDGVFDFKKFGKAEFEQSLLDHGASPQHVNDWLKVRTAKRATFTETALNRFLNECENNNFPVAEAVRICAEKSWQGFEYQWVLNQQSNARTTKTNDLSNLKRLSEGVMVAVESGYVPRRDN